MAKFVSEERCQSATDTKLFDEKERHERRHERAASVSCRHSSRQMAPRDKCSITVVHSA